MGPAGGAGAAVSVVYANSSTSSTLVETLIRPWPVSGIGPNGWSTGSSSAALVAQGAVSPDRLILRVAPGQRRAVTLSVGFAGDLEIQAGDPQ